VFVAELAGHLLELLGAYLLDTVAAHHRVTAARHDQPGYHRVPLDLVAACEGCHLIAVDDDNVLVFLGKPQHDLGRVSADHDA
jgi:hypothetical protein